MTTGDVLDESQQRAFERFIRRGGGFAGVHSAADTEYGWPWYGGLVGAYFKSHPAGSARNRPHRGSADTPRPPVFRAAGQRTDEWYNFARNPRPSVHVLATLDETSYSPGPGAMGADHPIAWWQPTRAGAPGTRPAGTRRSPTPTRSSGATSWAGSATRRD